MGDESRKLNFGQRQELEFDKGQSQFDGLPVDSNIESLDEALTTNYQQSVGATGTVRRLFEARSLVTSRGRLTNAGYLLFASYPQTLFPEAYVRVIRFLTMERGTGARLGIDENSDYRIEGPIPRVITDASRKIDELMPRRRRLSAAGRFESTPIVPRDAWLEGVVNAVIHRSYSLSGDHVRVEIYPDRIEIESPGRFPGLADPATPLEISRFARNPRIARVCADLRIGQELGEGIKRIFEEMRRVGLTDPIYRQGQGSVRLTLQDVPRLDAKVAERLPRHSQRILDVMRASDSPLSTGDVASAMGLSRPATMVRLRALRDEGLIRWVGKSPNEPRATWIEAPD